LAEAFMPLSQAVTDPARPRGALNWRLAAALLMNLAAWGLIAVIARRFIAP
jgi:hypothetical protein